MVRPLLQRTARSILFMLCMQGASDQLVGASLVLVSLALFAYYTAWVVISVRYCSSLLCGFAHFLHFFVFSRFYLRHTLYKAGFQIGSSLWPSLVV